MALNSPSPSFDGSPKHALSVTTSLEAGATAVLETEKKLKCAVDSTLRSLLPAQSLAPTHLHRAMHYAVLAPGKRLRPLFTLLTVGELHAPSPVTLRLACVPELVHTASLLLDDLPCMDNASMRRNQPCTHLQFSESTAILAAVNLLNLAYSVIATCPHLAAETKVAVSAHLAEVVGSLGLVGGQVEDLQNDLQHRSAVQQVYHQKTGCLFEFAVVTGARLRGLDDNRIDALYDFARAFGLLFQIYDDALDQPSFSGKTGKDVGKDAGKSTLLASLSPEQLEQVLADAQQTLRRALHAAQLDQAPLGLYTQQQLARFDGAFRTASRRQ